MLAAINSNHLCVRRAAWLVVEVVGFEIRASSQ